MKFLKIKYDIKSYEAEGFKHGDKIIALLDNGEVKHGTLFFVEGYSTVFEIQMILDSYTGKSVDLYEALVCKIEVV